MIEKKSKDVLVRGLNNFELKKLETIRDTMNFKSNNDLFLFIIRKFLEPKNELKSSEVYLKEISKSNDLLLQNLKLRSKSLNEIEKRVKKNSEEIIKIVDEI